jgi:hypothetical protein
LPGGAAAAARAEAAGLVPAALAGASAATAAASADSNQPIVVNVQMDGEVVARAAHNAGKSAAARSFAPVPSY